jgi:hypothetical protein
MKLFSLKAVLALATILCAFTQVSSAQVLYGSLTGTVTDSSDAAVPGATITITNKATGAVRTAATNDQGGYNIPTVQGGLYTLKITKDGFRTVVQDNVEVLVNSTARVDMKLQLGQVAETINVEAGVATLQTDRAEVKAEISSKTLTEIPVSGQRNYQSLFITLPGISPPGTPHSVPSNPSRAMSFSVNGANTASNNTRIDGASATNIWLPHIASYVPALESIDTVNVVTNSFDAEQGLAGGASVNVIIRSGTNDLRGALFEYHQGNWSQARNFFLPSNQDVPKFVYNQFGGRLGGALIKNKLFYFGSYEATYDRRFAGGFYTVPTPAMRTGDLSATNTIIYDPGAVAGDGTGRQPFPGNRIPTSRIHPTSARLMSALVQQNVPNAGAVPSNNYFATAPATFDRHTIDSKVNYNISDKWTMYGRLSWLKFDMLSQTPFGELGGPPIAFGNPGKGFGGTWSGSLASTYTLSPRLIIDANFGYTLMDANVEQPGLGTNVGRETLGIPGTNGTRYFESGYPGFGIGGFAAFGSTENYMPYYRNDPQFQYVANANWLAGKHNVRFGMDIYHLQLNHTQPEFAGANGGAAGRLNFGQGPTQLLTRNPNGTTSTSGGNLFNSMGTYLLGLVDGGGRILQVPDEYTTRTTMYSFYIRDQWQVNRNLTLSYGTRIEMFPMPYRNDQQGMERYDFQTNEMIVCGLGGTARDCGTKVKPAYISPRLGIAYRLNDKTVIRTGFGINWDPWNLARPLRTNYPVLAALNLQPPALGWATTLSQGIPNIPAPVIGQNGRLPIPNNYAVNTTTDEFSRAYLMNYNFTIQREVSKGWVAQAGYVGSRSIRTSGRLNMNAGQVIGADQAGQPLRAQFNRVVETSIVGPVGSNTYHSLQTSLNKRYSAGLQANFTYTWSKVIGICCNDDNNGGPAVPALAYYDRNRTLLPWDRTHNFQTTLSYELPFGKGKPMNSSNGFVSALISGWQVNTLVSLMSGTPFTVTSDGGSLRLPGSTQTADQLKPEVQTKLGIGRNVAWIDPTAFARVTEARFGNSSLHQLRGPGFFNSDLGLFRQFAFKERFNLQFRTELFNWTNTPKFSNPNAAANNLIFTNGQYTGGSFDITGTNAGGREPNGDRILRLGLRLSF